MISKKPNTKRKSEKRQLKKPRLSSIIKATGSKVYMLVLLALLIWIVVVNA